MYSIKERDSDAHVIGPGQNNLVKGGECNV